MRELGTNKLGSHIMNSHIKRPRNINKLGDRFFKNSQFLIAHIQIPDKKTAYNEVRLYTAFPSIFDMISDSKTFVTTNVTTRIIWLDTTALGQYSTIAVTWRPSQLNFRYFISQFYKFHHKLFNT